MIRLIFSDEAWKKLLVKLGELGIYDTPRLRSITEGIFWRIRTGAPWRDLPAAFGSWQTVYNRFNRWSAKGLWEQIFESAKGECDHEWEFMDGSTVKVHQHASGARKGEAEAIGASRGGHTTKIHMLADAHGNPIHFEITQGQSHELSIAEDFFKYCSPGAMLINDKGYDSHKFRQTAQAHGVICCIPRRKGSVKNNPEFDSYLYRLRHLVENLFARLKHFRAVATRYDKLARNYLAVLYAACTFIWLKL